MADMPIGNIPQSAASQVDAYTKIGADTAKELAAEMLSAAKDFKESTTEMVNPFAARFATKQKELKAREPRIKELMKARAGDSHLLPPRQIKEWAEQFQKQNRELKSAVLELLSKRIKAGDKKDDILKTIREFYSDVTLADQALEFLLAVTTGDLKEEVKEALTEFRKDNERQINAGKNITEQVYSPQYASLGTPSNMRDLYRDITGNPRDSVTLFEQLSTQYPYSQLKPVLGFLLSSLGSDMKSKGPSIPRAELARLITETKSLQAILGVYRFFSNRMNLVEKMFQQLDLPVPAKMNFESLSKGFMALVRERYPSREKVLHQAPALGVDKDINGQIIAFTAFRDAIREVAVNQIYRSIDHRNELHKSIIEALEDLEDTLDDINMAKEQEIEDYRT